MCVDVQVMNSGMAHCTCQRGFFGDHCESHRPCNVYVCRNNGTCVYTPDQDICYCQPGFSGSRNYGAFPVLTEPVQLRHRRAFTENLKPVDDVASSCTIQ